MTGRIVPEGGLMQIYARQPGVITAVDVVEGAEVKKGDRLVTLSTELESAAFGATGVEVARHLSARKQSLLDDRRNVEQLAEQQKRALQEKMATAEAAHAALNGQYALQGQRVQSAAKSVKRQRALQEESCNGSATTRSWPPIASSPPPSRWASGSSSSLRIHGERLADIALTPPEERGQGTSGPAAAPSIACKPAGIEVKGLRFRYSEQDPWVLDGVDLRIEPGESVAIVGASGCGKTTLLKILSSLLQPSAGEVLVDGKPSKQAGLARYREMLGVVMQDDQLFAGSIADNIALFADPIDFGRVEACARKAAVHDAIAAMPMGYATLIGDMGAALSGGQKQRILIARALYREPSILLLDEATSHLDVRRERAVNDAIAKSHITRVIVAHRPETILSAERVMSSPRAGSSTRCAVARSRSGPSRESLRASARSRSRRRRASRNESRCGS